MTFDFLIVGAGFAGSVLAERLASQLGKTCLIVEKRNHIGGNAYDHYDRAGDRKSTRLNSSHSGESRMPSSA